MKNFTLISINSCGGGGKGRVWWEWGGTHYQFNDFSAIIKFSPIFFFRQRRSRNKRFGFCTVSEFFLVILLLMPEEKKFRKGSLLPLGCWNVFFFFFLEKLNLKKKYYKNKILKEGIKNVWVVLHGGKGWSWEGLKIYLASMEDYPAVYNSETTRQAFKN